MFSPVCADNFGMKNLAVNYGFLYIAYGLAGFIGPQIAARVKIISGGYQGAFYVVTVMAIVGILFILYLRRQMNSNRSLKEQGVQNG
jgi:OFA family oxalate/formate antiporter-like MFS transporter